MAIDTYPSDSLRIAIDATAGRLGEIRSQLLDWLKATGVSDTTAADIVLVVNEACTNSIEHAYRNGASGRIELEANLEGRQIVVCVADFGIWKTPPRHSTTRGRGLPIMHAVSDRVELDHTGTGTTVRITFDAGA